MRQDLHIRILMCTHNGAAHLQEQLDSLVAQSHANWSLWVSDDGSQDATPQILETFRSDHPNREIRLLQGPKTGGAANYLGLLTHPELGHQVVALSDQDDVWMPDKLAHAARALAGASQDSPVAYAAGWRVCDAQLTPRGRSRKARVGPSFGNALVQNILSGHSLVLNAAALRLVAAAGCPPDIPFHDWWIYLLITGAGGDVILDDREVLYYRQHGQNVLGSNAGIRARILRLQLMFGPRYSRWIQANAQALVTSQAPLTSANRTVLDRFLTARKPHGLAGLRRLQASGIHRQARLETGALMLAALLGRI